MQLVKLPSAHGQAVHRSTLARCITATMCRLRWKGRWDGPHCSTTAQNSASHPRDASRSLSMCIFHRRHPVGRTDRHTHTHLLDPWRDSLSFQGCVAFKGQITVVGPMLAQSVPVRMQTAHESASFAWPAFSMHLKPTHTHTHAHSRSHHHNHHQHHYHHPEQHDQAGGNLPSCAGCNQRATPPDMH